MSQEFTDEQLRQYVLGDLPAAEERELELALFRKAELLARVDLARDDLVDDYAAGRLSDADRVKLERRQLSNAEGREQLAIAKALRNAAAARGKNPPNGSPKRG